MHSKAFIEKTGEGLSAEKQMELHDMINRGDIDIGPMPDHSKPLEDKRYLGPSAEELGLALLARHNGKHRTMP